MDGEYVEESEIFRRAGALIFVIDAQDQPADALERLREVAARAAEHNPRLPFDIFLHKMDGDLFQTHQHRAGTNWPTRCVFHVAQLDQRDCINTKCRAHISSVSSFVFA